MNLKELMSKPIAPALKEGQHNVILKDYIVKTSSKFKNDGSTEEKEYLQIVLNNGTRNINDNKFTEKSVSITVSHIRKQLGREYDEIVPIEFLNELKENQTPLTIWVTKDNGYTNINYLEPLDKTETTTEEVTEVDVI